MTRVLVLDGLQRKSLELVRCLGMGGHEVHVADSSRWFSSRFSRYASRSVRYPDPSVEPSVFLDWLHRQLERWPAEVVIPTDDVTTGLLAHHPGALEPARALLPPAASFETMRDKGQAAHFFGEHGVPHPQTGLPQSWPEVREAVGKTGFPLVIKPRVSSGSRGVRFVTSASEFDMAYQEVHRRFPWPVIQHRVQVQRRVSMGGMWLRGKLQAGVVYEVLRQYPPSGGTGTTYQTVHDPAVLALACDLMSKLNWTGPADIDLVYDEQDQPLVLEVNPRYGQPLVLARSAGLNVPAVHLQLLLSDRAVDDAPQVAPAGALSRSLIPFDILAYLTDPKRSKFQPPFFSWPQGTVDDLLSWDDPGPALALPLTIFEHLLDRQMWWAVVSRK